MVERSAGAVVFYKSDEDVPSWPMNIMNPPMTEFEERVYAVLRTVSPGSLITYSEVARRAGYPRAARAVGNALNKNPFAPEVPCHRVIHADGTLGGYGFGGAETKKTLLESEGIRFDGDKVASQ